MSDPRVLRALLVSVAATLLLVGCQGGLPADPQGTLVRATGGVLRVGVGENPPWTEVASDGTVTGSEVALLSDYAETIDAEVEWVPAGENTLAAMMREGRLDVVVGGLASDVPWTSEIATTRPYTTTIGADGSEVKVVVGVRPGENALMTDIERFLAERGGEL